VQIAKQAQRPGPEPLELSRQLVTQRGSRADEILPPAGQRPQRFRRIRVGLEHPEAVIVGARQLADHERVKAIRLAARDPKPIAGRWRLIREVDRHATAAMGVAPDRIAFRPRSWTIAIRVPTSSSAISTSATGHAAAPIW
jgi:hypothetical protein